MDAIEFLEERKRMCEMHCKCTECSALLDNNQCIFSTPAGIAPVEQVKFLEEWSAAHPLVNRQMSFLSHYPNADIDDDGVLKVCPKVVEGKNYVKPETCGSVPCSVCRLAYWSVVER